MDRLAVKRISMVFYIVFAACFILMVGIMVKGLIDQNADEKEQKARYEKMINEGSKTKLTDKILEEDHEKFLQDAVKAKKTFITLSACFAGVALMFFVTAISTNILKRLEGGPQQPLAVTIVSVAVLLFIFITFTVTVFKVIIPKLVKSDPSDDAYAFVELHLVDSEKKEEIVEHDDGDTKTTETRVTYFLIEEDGNKIEVNKLFYDRYEGPGVYYAGRTSKGSVFSLYSGKYFELA